MEGKETALLDFLGSLGAVLTTIAAVFYFGNRASGVGKVTLCFLGAVILIISLPGIASVRMLIPMRGKVQERPRAQPQLILKEEFSPNSQFGGDGHRIKGPGRSDECSPGVDAGLSGNSLRERGSGGASADV